MLSNTVWFSHISTSPTDIISKAFSNIILLKNFCESAIVVSKMDCETEWPVDPTNTIHANLAALRDFPVTIHFQSIGSAPTLKKTKFRIPGKSKFADIIYFLKKALKLENDPYLYIQNCFSPMPDEHVADLCKCFGRNDDILSISYSLTPAFG